MELHIAQPFDLGLNLTMGQAFRWRAEGDWYSGVVQGSSIKIRRTKEGVEFLSSTPEESVSILLQRYFRLDEDVESIYCEISRDSPRVSELVKQYRGMRILRQEPWECLISYICSAHNNIQRISGIVERLSDAFGRPIYLDGVQRNSFPAPESLVEAGKAALDRLGLGLRRPDHIYRAAQEVEKGSLDLSALTEMPYDEAKKRLTECPGIGPKIADCILLFSLEKAEAFPIDRWVLRALLESGLPDRTHALVRQALDRKTGLSEPGYRAISQGAREYFGCYAGYANQFLFHDINPVK